MKKTTREAVQRARAGATLPGGSPAPAATTANAGKPSASLKRHNAPLAQPNVWPLWWHTPPMRVSRVAWFALGLVAWPIQYAAEFLRFVVDGYGGDDMWRLRPWFLDKIRR